MDMEKVFKLNLKNLSSRYPDTEMIKNIKGFIQQQQLYNAAIKEIRTKLEILDDEFQVKYDHNPIHHMEYRLKSPESIVAKLHRRRLELSLESIWNHLTDVAGVRLICHYIDDIYRIAELLLKQDDIKLVKKNDYIARPKPNGYRSLHLIVEVPVFLAESTKFVPVEIQIRTIAMDFWACLEHQLEYKTNNAVSNDLRQRLKNCAESISDIDVEMQSIYRDIKQKNADNA